MASSVPALLDELEGFSEVGDEPMLVDNDVA
jgi:hypothetical protein